MRNRQFVANFIDASSLTYRAQSLCLFIHQYCNAIRRAGETVTTKTMGR
jgi:hypothetical protein